MRADLKILQARHEGMTYAADHFLGQLLRERRRLAMARKALAEIADNEPWLRSLNADYVADTARQAIEEIE